MGPPGGIRLRSREEREEQEEEEEEERTEAKASPPQEEVPETTLIRQHYSEIKGSILLLRSLLGAGFPEENRLGQEGLRLQGLRLAGVPALHGGALEPAHAADRLLDLRQAGREVRILLGHDGCSRDAHPAARRARLRWRRRWWLRFSTCNLWRHSLFGCFLDTRHGSCLVV